MVVNSKGLHHYHKRKRVHKNLEKFPHPNKWKRFMDKSIFVIGVAGPIMTLPQVFKIWVEKNAAGVSALSWGAFAVLAVFWVIYGFMHKEKPIIITYICWIVVEVLIVIGTILYG